MDSREALKKLVFYSDCFELESFAKILEKDLDKLEKYQKLFEELTNEKNQGLKFSTTDLECFYRGIENK